MASGASKVPADPTEMSGKRLVALTVEIAA
jgi:hypothetical protein